MKGAKIMEKIRNTKENVLKLLEAQSKSAWNRAKYAKEDGRMDVYRKEMSIMGEIESAIRLLTNQDYFQDIWNIYMNKEDENNG